MKLGPNMASVERRNLTPAKCPITHPNNRIPFHCPNKLKAAVPHPYHSSHTI